MSPRQKIFLKIFKQKSKERQYLHSHSVAQADTGRQMALQDQNAHTACPVGRTVLRTARREWDKSLLVVDTRTCTIQDVLFLKILYLLLNCIISSSYSIAYCLNFKLNFTCTICYAFVFPILFWNPFCCCKCLRIASCLLICFTCYPISFTCVYLSAVVLIGLTCVLLESRINTASFYLP